MTEAHLHARPVSLRLTCLPAGGCISVGVAGIFFLLCALTSAQDSLRSHLHRFELAPLASYRSSLSIPVQPGVQGANQKAVLDASPSYGVAVGVHIREDNIVEFRWTRQDSNIRVQDANLIYPQARLTLDQFYCDFSQQYVLTSRAPWARLFVVGSVGATNISGAANSVATHFSAGIGGGVRFLAGRHWGFRMQAQWQPIFLQEHGEIVCGTACAIHTGEGLGSQFEVTVGPTFRF